MIRGTQAKLHYQSQICWAKRPHLLFSEEDAETNIRTTPVVCLWGLLVNSHKSEPFSRNGLDNIQKSPTEGELLLLTGTWAGGACTTVKIPVPRVSKTRKDALPEQSAGTVLVQNIWHSAWHTTAAPKCHLTTSHSSSTYEVIFHPLSPLLLR